MRAALVPGLSAAIALGVFVTTLARPSPARAEGCVVRGAALTLDSVVVRPAGAPKLLVDVSELPATAHIPTTPGAPAPLTFSGAVAFAGTAKNIWYELGKPALAHHGIVHLSVGARLARAHAEGSDVVGRLVWLSEDALEGEDKDADVWVAAVRVPCASLRLANATGSAEAAADPSPGDGTWWEMRRGSARLVLHAAPREASPTAVLRSDLYGDDKQWDVERVAEQGRWMKVTTASGGARMTGWIRRDEVEPLDGPPGVGGGCYGEHGRGYGVRRWGGSGKPPKIAHKGPAELAVGTTVYAHRGGGGAWATVVGRDARFGVVVYEGEEWAEVTRVPGVGGTDLMAGGAYVRAGAVRRGEGR